MRHDLASAAAVIMLGSLKMDGMSQKAKGKAGQMILDELGYLPFSASGGALLFHLLSKLYERTSVIITLLGGKTGSVPRGNQHAGI